MGSGKEWRLTLVPTLCVGTPVLPLRGISCLPLQGRRAADRVCPRRAWARAALKSARYDTRMPRFVILRHDMPPGGPRASHFDLMLEQDGILRTWACDALPQADSPTLADPLPDHRIAYLTYEGEVSGNRGRVTRVAAGEYELLEETPLLVRARLSSGTITGVLTMARSEGQHAHRWRVSLDPVAPSSG